MMRIWELMMMMRTGVTVYLFCCYKITIMMMIIWESVSMMMNVRIFDNDNDDVLVVICQQAMIWHFMMIMMRIQYAICNILWWWGKGTSVCVCERVIGIAWCVYCFNTTMMMIIQKCMMVMMNTNMRIYDGYDQNSLWW